MLANTGIAKARNLIRPEYIYEGANSVTNMSISHRLNGEKPEPA